MDDATALAIVEGSLPCNDQEAMLEAERVYMALFYGNKE